MRKQHLQLMESERIDCQAIIKKGDASARTFKRALALLELDKGKTITAVALTIEVTNDTVAALRDRYKEQGLACLKDAPRPGRPIKIDGKQRAQVTALACSNPPKGYAKWSLRLLADKVVELNNLDSISHTQVNHILKKQT